MAAFRRGEAGHGDRPELRVADGAYSWNAGIFLFRPDAFLGEAERTAPDTGRRRPAPPWTRRPRAKGDLVRLGEAFRRVPSLPVDVAVFERTDKAVVVAADVGWSDVGAFDALWTGKDEDALRRRVAGSGDHRRRRQQHGDHRRGRWWCWRASKALAVIVENGVVLVTRRDDAGAIARGRGGGEGGEAVRTSFRCCIAARRLRR